MKVVSNLILSLMGLCLIGGSASAASDLRIGVVDFQKALISVEEGKAVAAAIKKEFDAKNADLDAKGKVIEKLQAEVAELDKQARTMKPDMLKPDFMEKGRKKVEDLQKKAQDYEQLRRKTAEEYQKRNAESSQDIVVKLKQISDEVGRKGTYTVIFEKSSGLLYASALTDLTEEVIQAYNSKFKGKGKPASASKEKK